MDTKQSYSISSRPSRPYLHNNYGSYFASYYSSMCAAIGLYPLGSLLNHGCQANACQVFDGRHLEFRVISPIKKGEEIVVPYVNGAMTRAERRICLSDRYFFDICSQVSA